MTIQRVRLPEKLAQLFEGEARYRIAYGGRGSGKSVGFAKMFLISMLRHPGETFLACREIQNSIQDSVHSILKQEIIELNIGFYFDVGESFIRTNQGANVVYRGLLRHASEIKSMNNIRTAWVEEAQSVSHKSLDYLLPTVRNEGSEIWFTFNPEDETDPVYDTFVAHTRRRSKVVKINYNDNPFFPAVLDEERLNDFEHKPKKYDWIWLGMFNTDPEGTVYASYVNQAEQDGRFLDDIYDPELPVYTAWDKGFGNSTCIWFFQVLRNEVRLIDYYQASGQNVRHYCEQLYGRKIDVSVWGEDGKPKVWKLGEDIPDAAHRKKYNYGEHYVPHDAANKLLEAGGRSMISQMADFSIKNTRRVAATNSKNQIDGTRETLRFCYFDKNRTKDGIRALRKYKFKYDENLLRYSNEPLHDWASDPSDAFEVISQVWKSPRPPSEKQKPRFLEQMTAKELFFPEGLGGNQGHKAI